MCLRGRKATEEEQNRQCMWTGIALQFGFDYMKSKQKGKKNKKNIWFW